MTLLWGGVLAAGILLALSPWLWPATGEKRPDDLFDKERISLG